MIICDAVALLVACVIIFMLLNYVLCCSADVCIA